MATQFTLDVPALMRVLNEDPAVTALHQHADQAVTDAHTAPRGAHPGTHEVDKIAVGATHIGPQGATVDIDWPSPFWHLIEFGSVNNPPYRPITRGAQNAGLKVIDKRGSA